MFRIRKIDKVSVSSLPKTWSYVLFRNLQNAKLRVNENKEEEVFVVKTGYVFKMLTES